MTDLLPSELPQLLQSSALLRSLVVEASCSRQCVTIHDGEKPWRVVYVNAAWENVCGWSLQEVFGSTLTFLQGDLTDRKAVSTLVDATEKGEGTSVRLVNYSRSGAPFCIKLVTRHFTDGASGLTWLQSCGDIQWLSAVEETMHGVIRMRSDSTVSAAGTDVEGVVPVTEGGPLSEELSDWEDIQDYADDSAAHPHLMSLLITQNVLVKTISNSGWKAFMQRMQSGPFQTPTTLLPPSGKSMRLFGRPTEFSTGLLWSAEMLQVEDSYKWNSGCFAKTEFNMDSKGNLSKSLRDSLCSLQQLRATNIQISSQPHICPYNEVLCKVSADAIVGVLCRSLQHRHILLAMGVQYFVEQETGRKVPILLMHPQHGAYVLSNHQQLQVLRFELLRPEATSDSISDYSSSSGMQLARPELLPLSLDCFGQLTKDERLQLYGLLQCDHQSIHRLVSSEPDPDMKRKQLWMGLGCAVHSNNAAAATQFVQYVMLLPVGLLAETETHLALIAHLCDSAQSVEMLVVLGACKVLWMLRCGALWKHLKTATRIGKEWCNDSFYNLLLHLDGRWWHRWQLTCQLEDCLLCPGEKKQLKLLMGVVAGLHKPRYRLNLMQYALGLDYRWTLPLLLETVQTSIRLSKFSMSHSESANDMMQQWQQWQPLDLEPSPKKSRVNRGGALWWAK